jgi:formylglycine-generating enzyme required for sulfatase activity
MADKPVQKRCRAALIISLFVVPALGANAFPGDFGEASAALRLAIEDLIETHGDAYPHGPDYLRRLDALCAEPEGKQARTLLHRLKAEVLLAHPLLDFEQLLVLKRKRGQIGLPTNHQCNTTLKRIGYDNELALLAPVRPEGDLSTLYRPEQGRFVGEMDLHFDGDRLLFTMANDKNWNIYEIDTRGHGLRRVNRNQDTDIDCFDACYLPDGRIVFASTAGYTSVPCWHGKERACSLYLMDADGAHMRQLCFDQDLDLHPAVLSSGQIIYSRWDYTGIMHMYMRPLMVMNPDGSAQRAVYGSNSYWPNALFFPREIPGHPGKLICILAGYHNDPRMGQLALLDLSRGWYEERGVVQMIPGRGKKIEPIIRDALTMDVWPKFLHPYPLSEKYFLVSQQPRQGAPWGIYLVDVFDNAVPVLVDAEHDFFEPIPIQALPRPHVIPDQVDLAQDDAVVYLHDVYTGPGLNGVPRGIVKSLRIGAYHYGVPGMAGPDKCGSGGPWEVMRILGTVPVNEDGSAVFRVPACTPLTLQPLDGEGKAVQLMRSWYTAMPGERISCVGCHENPKEVPTARIQQAAYQEPATIKPWYGPARGFDFAREVQPVLDAYCVTCHNGERDFLPDLRAEEHVPHYTGRELNRLGRQRLHPEVKAYLGGTRLRYTPAYEALLPYIRRVNVEDDVRILIPGEYHADTSELIQMLKKGHQGLRLDRESWDRLVTWIDLNGPCHGTWNEVAPVPDQGARRRWELAQRYGGPRVNPETVPDLPPVKIEPLPVPTGTRASQTSGVSRRRPVIPAAIPAEPQDASRSVRWVDLGKGVTLQLVKVPAGSFVMGDPEGEPDEVPCHEVTLAQSFWMGAFEVTNEQYHRFDPEHRSGLYHKRFISKDGPGMSLEAPRQPVVRVSWERAQAYCRWLSRRTGLHFHVPTEAQWEYACRAGTNGALSYGSLDSDFSLHANMADDSLRVPLAATGGVTTNLNLHKGNGVFESALYGSVVPCIGRFNDRHTVTAEVGRFQPNPWGLYDMHGNVSEWTATAYGPYPCDARDGRHDPPSRGERVVRGGSWVDRPKRCRSAFRLSYPAWQRVFNVGFRVCCEETNPLAHAWPQPDTEARP